MPIQPAHITNQNNRSQGTVISFLGPDGSGKSTIISALLDQPLPFERNDYFHLKPILKKEGALETVVADPHAAAPYSAPKSYLKLLFFIYQYNKGWHSNIVPLKRKKALVIFDRYYDDLLVDPRRYRFGGKLSVAKWVRKLIPKPELYFILTADAGIIHRRKKEVSFTELERQLKEYRLLADGKRYHCINVNRGPEEIAAEVKKILLSHIR